MSPHKADPYVRLLRWYPPVWRETHGAVFLDTPREQSEHEGRTLPSRGDAAQRPSRRAWGLSGIGYDVGGTSPVWCAAKARRSAHSAACT